MAKAIKFTIIVDTREQLPYTWDQEEQPWVRAGLKTGDYSVQGMEELVTIERKSLPDLFGCIGNGRERFERELVRMSEMKFAAVVIEGSMKNVLIGITDSQVHPKSAIGSILAWSVYYGVHMVFAEDRAHGSAATRKLLEKFVVAQARTNELVEEVNLAQSKVALPLGPGEIPIDDIMPALDAECGHCGLEYPCDCAAEMDDAERKPPAAQSLMDRFDADMPPPLVCALCRVSFEAPVNEVTVADKKPICLNCTNVRGGE